MEELHRQGRGQLPAKLTCTAQTNFISFITLSKDILVDQYVLLPFSDNILFPTRQTYWSTKTYCCAYAMTIVRCIRPFMPDNFHIVHYFAEIYVTFYLRNSTDNGGQLPTKLTCIAQTNLIFFITLSKEILVDQYVLLPFSDNILFGQYILFPTRQTCWSTNTYCCAYAMTFCSVDLTVYA